MPLTTVSTLSVYVVITYMAFKTRFQRVRFETVGWSPQEMSQAADGLIKRGLMPRIAMAQTIHDMPAPPLKPGYARYKVRIGRKAIRDLFRTGQSIRSMKTLRAGANRAVIGFSTPKANSRIFMNNQLSPQFGVSPRDRVVLGEEYRKLPSPIKVVKVGSGRR